MSLTTTEYAVHRIWLENHEIISVLHGPYDTFELADQQRHSNECLTNKDSHRQADAEWVVVERDVTPWTPAPKNSHHWPDDD